MDKFRSKSSVLDYFHFDFIYFIYDIRTDIYWLHNGSDQALDQYRDPYTRTGGSRTDKYRTNSNRPMRKPSGTWIPRPAQNQDLIKNIRNIINILDHFIEHNKSLHRWNLIMIRYQEGMIVINMVHGTLVPWPNPGSDSGPPQPGNILRRFHT